MPEPRTLEELLDAAPGDVTVWIRPGYAQANVRGPEGGWSTRTEATPALALRRVLEARLGAPAAVDEDLIG